MLEKSLIPMVGACAPPHWPHLDRQPDPRWAGPRRSWMFQNADEAKKFIADEGVKFVDVRFCDLPGVMQHFTVPVSSFDPSEELAFDGSSIRGFQAIHESDMALRADLSTARVDPFRADN